MSITITDPALLARWNGLCGPSPGFVMNARRITRRQALAAGFGTAATGWLAAAPMQKDDANKSWVGKTVLPKKFALGASVRAAKEPNKP